MVRASVSLFALASFTPAWAYIAPSGAQPHGVSAHNDVSGAAAVHLRQAARHIKQEQEPPSSSWNPLILGLVMGVFAAAVGGRAPAALAADAGAGEAVFAANCASCHAGGNNSISPDKKLTKEKLQQYGKYEPAMIKSQVAKGNGSMPAFGAKISPEDVDDVVAYVREKADKGW